MNQFFNILVTLLLSTTLFGNAADSTSLDLNDITLTLTNFNKIFKHDEDSADSTSLALDVFEIHTQATNIQSISCIVKGVKTIDNIDCSDNKATLVTTGENQIAITFNTNGNPHRRFPITVSTTELNRDELSLADVEILTVGGTILTENIKVIQVDSSFWSKLFDWQRYVGIFGILAILGIAYLMSNNKKNIDFRLVKWGLGLQLIFGIFILVTPFGKPIFSWFDKGIKKLLSFSTDGSEFLFASFTDGKMHPAVINFAFAVLPTVIFFSALMAVLYHIGLMQKIIRFVSLIMQKTMKTSGPETTSISANIFVGQTEAPLVIKPFVSTMTKSELMAVMTGGFATVAGGVMAIYVGLLEHIPGIAGHLMAASIMSAPAALVIAKIMYPESEREKVNDDDDDESTKLSSNLNEPVEGNALEALGNGATEGLKLAANIAAMLIAFVALISLSNYMLSIFGTSLESIFGYIFMPLAFLMGAPWSESHMLGSLLGQKIVLTELIAYMNLAEIQNTVNAVSDKTAILASYALCGFANFASIGIQLGGIGSIAPKRKKDLSKLVTKAMFGGALASWLTATIAGILI